MEAKLDEYYSSINFLCRNIVAERKNFASLLGQQWLTLSSNEQDALLDEHFVPPEIKQLYTSGSVEDGSNLIPECYPRLKIKSGQKVVEDDEGEIWQDEHSGPFSWETSSQSEFSLEDDLSNTDAIKSRLKDPKRPKSPRLMKHLSGGDNSVPRPGALERTSSTDFQQLRHIWESHHSVTPDSEIAPPFPPLGYLSRSQMSLTGSDVMGTRHTSSVENIAEVVNESDMDTSVNLTAKGGLADNPSTISLKSFNPDKDPEPLTTIPLVLETPANKGSRKEAGAPLAVKEDDTDITAIGMKEDVRKLEEIKVTMEKTMASTSPAKEPAIQTQSSSQAESGSEPANQDEDILKKFGVTFSYGDEEPGPPTNSDVMAAAAFRSKPSGGRATSDTVEKTEKPSSGFDFLTSW